MSSGIFSNNSARITRKGIAASQTLEQPVPRKQSKTQTAPYFERLVLVVNSNTVLPRVEQVIRAMNQSRIPMLVVYTSKPPLLVEGKHEGEVDYEFAFRLDYGKNFLQRVSRLAEQLGVASVETSFVWENFAEDLVEKVNETGDRTVDLTQN